MYLTKPAAPWFDGPVRARAVDYTQGRTRILRGTNDEVRARVTGTAVYDVGLRAKPGKLLVSCTCPYFTDRDEPCKHAWATIVVAERQGHLGAMRGARAFSVLPSDVTLTDESLDIDDGPADGIDPVTTAIAERFAAPRAAIVHAPAPAVSRAAGTSPSPELDWRVAVDLVRNDTVARRAAAAPRSGHELGFVIDADRCLTSGGLVVEARVRPRPRGEPGPWRPQSIREVSSDSRISASSADREVLRRLAAWLPAPWSYGASLARAVVTEGIEPLTRAICETGHAALRAGDGTEFPLAWDSGAPWTLALRVEPDGAAHVAVRGELRRDGESLDLAAPHLLLAGGVVFAGERAASLDPFAPFGWVSILRQHAAVRAPRADLGPLLAELLESDAAPAVAVAADFGLREETVAGRPFATVRKPSPSHEPQLAMDAGVDYDRVRVPFSRPGSRVVDLARSRIVVRDAAREAEALAALLRAGAKATPSWRGPTAGGPSHELPAKRLAGAVQALLEAGFHVEADGKLQRKPGDFQLGVSSGIDWFDLHGEMNFDGVSASLPALLAAVRRGDRAVVLDDGSVGILPEDWLAKWSPLLQLGTAERGEIRFRKSQVALLDALLAEQPEVTFDAGFRKLRDELARFDGVKAEAEPRGFVGTLREYQREGVGWMKTLRKLGFGGCLADDMGLGKTVQVLAMLQARKADRGRKGPSLVVAPRSLVFNWLDEARRFTPKLRVADHTGVGRASDADTLREHDVILTTYGTLRNDIELLRAIALDYAILDEAQAIKNASSESAKAARLLSAEHRLALTGTPIENHLGELWSLFEFLNPGLLGAASVFRGMSAATRTVDDGTRRLLSRALRPFLLRRTKAEVARELPDRVEQTLTCELGRKERKRYDELRAHYRAALLARVDRDGMGRSTVHVLEALLRLRQAACHPGLLDPARTDEPSAKLDLLLDQLAAVRDEGHKAIVFSQFTSLLAIVRARLDDAGIAYEYLDGRTRDRKECVARFQTEPTCSTFLVSLKAGGIGLNLTAAGYVFLLDPWWNPAVEAQAIDRAHRIGQTHKVVAYRLLAEDTVEQKVAELQRTKQELADAILGADGAGIRGITREDLVMLLG